MADGDEIVFVQTPTQDWLVLVQVDDAITLTAAYKVDPGRDVDQFVRDLQTA
jgi:hypothetical protein